MAESLQTPENFASLAGRRGEIRHLCQLHLVSLLDSCQASMSESIQSMLSSDDHLWFLVAGSQKRDSDSIAIKRAQDINNNGEPVELFRQLMIRLHAGETATTTIKAWKANWAIKEEQAADLPGISQQIDTWAASMRHELVITHAIQPNGNIELKIQIARPASAPAAAQAE